MIPLLAFMALIVPSYSAALTCVEQVSQDVIDPDEANLAGQQIARAQLRVYSSIYPTLYYEMNLPVIDCSSRESMKIMGSEVIPLLNPTFYSGDQGGGIDETVLYLDGSSTY